jgi:hypothetical protein
LKCGFSGSKNAVLNFAQAFSWSRNVSLLGLRIDHPNIGNTHREEIVDAFFYPNPAIFRRENLDAEKGWLREDLLLRVAQYDTDVGNAETSRLHWTRISVKTVIFHSFRRAKRYEVTTA